MNDERPERPISYHCPETGAGVNLNVTAKSLEEVQFRTMTIEACAACGNDHKLEKADLYLGPAAAPETEGE